MRVTLSFLMAVLAMAMLSSCKGDKGATSESQQNYTCPMHPQIIQDKPGTCPICGMDLVPVGNDRIEAVVTLSNSQIELANITVQPARTEEIGSVIWLNATIKADETRTQLVTTRIPGRIDKLHYKETGVTINQGEVIYELYSEQLLTYQQEYLLALEQVTTSDSKRYESYLQAARKKLWLYGMTEKQIEVLKTPRDINPRIPIVAPASGTITEISVTEGQYVDEGTPVFRLEKLDKLWVEAELYPHEASLIKLGDTLTILLRQTTDFSLPGKVIFLSPEYRQGSQIFILRSALENTDHRWVPGMHAEIVLEHSRRKALTLPTDAVIREESGGHVYLKTGEGKFAPAMVKTGLENFSQVEIIEGINEGDSVVVSGAYLLYSEIILKKGLNPMVGHQHALPKAEKLVSETNVGEMLVVDPKFVNQLRGILLPYLQLKDALVSSDSRSASVAALQVGEVLKTIDMNLLKDGAHNRWMDMLKRTENLLKLIQASNNLEIQRASFSQLSETIYSSFKTFRVDKIKAYYQFCPMAFENKGAYWISLNETISNPYFGEQMLRCGETKETLK
ncbi:MAG TPA: efflux RND transporter periplasmic adaptor subunit [Cyclobacteriaceae bacterium]|nr:efflux RND transporter periplasmic adaptor subunit [Cyclobacteriaceae bacterium]